MPDSLEDQWVEEERWDKELQSQDRELTSLRRVNIKLSQRRQLLVVLAEAYSITDKEEVCDALDESLMELLDVLAKISLYYLRTMRAIAFSRENDERDGNNRAGVRCCW